MTKNRKSLKSLKKRSKKSNLLYIQDIDDLIDAPWADIGGIRTEPLVRQELEPEP